MLKKFIYILLPVLLLAGFAACGSDGDAVDAITTAERAMAEDEFQQAQTICDSLVNGNGAKQMNVTDLCRTSLIYMKLAEVQEQEFNTASAMTCMGLAIEKDSAAVDNFIAQRQGDEHSMLVMVQTLIGRTQLSEFKDEMDGLQSNEGDED